jgi:hypothetical protein
MVLDETLVNGAYRAIERHGWRHATLERIADDADEVATVVVNLVAWTYRHLRRGHGWDAERTRRRVLDIALEGVASR